MATVTQTTIRKFQFSIRKPGVYNNYTQSARTYSQMGLEPITGPLYRSRNIAVDVVECFEGCPVKYRLNN